MTFINSEGKLLLVGDNPFHRISHLSQERARSRAVDPGNPKHAAMLIMEAQKNGANGFTFSISSTTLEILKELKERDAIGSLQLHPVVPYAFEYVRMASQLGIPGLAKKFSSELASSRNIRSLYWGLRGALRVDLVSVLKTYLSYEISRLRSATSRSTRLDSMLLHQIQIP